MFPVRNHSFLWKRFSFWRSMIREKDSWSSEVYFAEKSSSRRFKSTFGFASSSSLSSSSASVPARVTGVSAPHVLGVSPLPNPGVLPCGVLPPVSPATFLLLGPGPGVITSVNFLPASRIQALFPLSTAFRYSRWTSTSARPGKKSRRMM